MMTKISKQSIVVALKWKPDTKNRQKADAVRSHFKRLSGRHIFGNKQAESGKERPALLQRHYHKQLCPGFTTVALSTGNEVFFLLFPFASCQLCGCCV